MWPRLFASFFFLTITFGEGHAAPVLVDGDWLQQHLQDKQLVVVDMTDVDLQYMRFHIPGAVRLAYSELLVRSVPGKPPGRLDAAKFSALLGHHGITRDHHVVIYDDMGGLNAGRLFLELEHIQHPEVSVLDGGLVKWVLDGKRVDNMPQLRMPATYKSGKAQRANLATLTEVKQLSGKPASVLLDVRSRDEYSGNPKEVRSGHIPGAHWWPWEQAIGMDNGFTFQEPEKLMASLEKTGVNDKQTPVILYCRSGHRASQSYLALRQLGFDNVRVYVGSTLDYLQDKNAPVTRGAAP